LAVLYFAGLQWCIVLLWHTRPFVHRRLTLLLPLCQTNATVCDHTVRTCTCVVSFFTLTSLAIVLKQVCLHTVKPLKDNVQKTF